MIDNPCTFYNYVTRVWGGRGRGWEWQQQVKNCPEKLHSEDMDTRAVHIVGHEAQGTQPWPRVQSRVDVIHLVRSTGAIVSNPHLHTVKSYPEKSRPIKNGHHNILCTV